MQKLSKKPAKAKITPQILTQVSVDQPPPFNSGKFPGYQKRISGSFSPEQTITVLSKIPPEASKKPSRPSLQQDKTHGITKNPKGPQKPTPKKPLGVSKALKTSPTSTKLAKPDNLSSIKVSPSKSQVSKNSEKSWTPSELARKRPFQPSIIEERAVSKKILRAIPTSKASLADAEKKRFIIGIDYGTTFTSVSYYVCSEENEGIRVFPSDVKSIINWPSDGSAGIRRQVPTESWYPNIPRVRLPKADPELSGDETNTEDDRNTDKPPFAPEGSENWSSPDSSGSGANQHFLDYGVDTDDSPDYLWGYEVPYQRYRASTTRNINRHIERPKLLLVTTKHTSQDRTKLIPRLRGLIKSGVIHKYGKAGNISMHDARDVVSDYLTRIFRHTKQQLIEHEGLNSNSCVEFVLTVPAIWHANSSRVMQFAMEVAIRDSGLGSLTYGCVDNLFLPTEPEAAATYLIEGPSGDLLVGITSTLYDIADKNKAGETFVMLDCGGGTVDGVAYTVSDSYPLHLHTEVGLPTGDNCGASYLNDNFENLLLKRLADEDYLDSYGETREGIVKQLIPLFEDYEKRNKDIAKRPSSRMKVPRLRGDQRQGLTGSDVKRFEDNFILLDSNDYNEIFMPILLRVGKVLRTQLEMAYKTGKNVRKVFLVGGFGAAPSLRSFLRNFLLDLAHEKNLSYEIDLITTTVQESASAIASGSILRALNKGGGPTRQAHSSYGFLRKESYQPDIYEGHRAATPVVDELDGESYVTVIDYFMLKNMVLRPVHKFKALKSCHAFELDNEELRCEELVYVSDTATRSQFPLDHYENRDAQIAGRIITKMKFLRSDTIIQQPVVNQDGDVLGKPHYLVSYDLIPIVEGRNLRYETKYGGKVQETGQISIASAFRPGTD